MTYPTYSGGWYEAINGILTGAYAWGVSYPDQATAAASNWFPAVRAGQIDHDQRYYTQSYTAVLTGNVVTVAYGAVVPLPLMIVQSAKISDLREDYQTALIAPVTFTTADGHIDSYSQDPVSVSNLQKIIGVGVDEWNALGLNLWMNESGIPVTPFTFADIQGLAAAMEAADVPEYKHLLLKISEVMSATTSDDVIAINW